MKFIYALNSRELHYFWKLMSEMYISLIYVQNLCSYFSLLIRKVLPLPISILDESHAELVDTHLPYGGNEESLNHVRACIHHLPNHCVTDEKGQPVTSRHCLWLRSGG